MSGPTQRFVYGRPVSPGEFVDRDRELRTVFNRLHNGESTAVVGAPHCGKTSLLLQIADFATRKTYLGEPHKALRVAFIDLHPIDTSYSSTAFWEQALEPLTAKPGHVVIRRKLEQVVEGGYSSRSLSSLLTSLASRNQHLVLLLDEFERLLVHPSFSEPTFLALLRSLATLTGGLALVLASRLSIAQMNRRGRDLLEVGSPFFNHFIELRLGPFDERSAEALLDRAAESLSVTDRRFIRRVAGRHPFLLQAMGAALLETEGQERQARAAERFYEQIAFHFDDLWEALDDRARTAAIVLSLVELGGRALGHRYDYREIQSIDAFGPELRRLAEHGLAEQVGQGWQFDWRYLLVWRGERWTVSAQAFTWWIRDVVTTEARSVRDYQEWLSDKRYSVLLTQEQWKRLMETFHKVPDWAVRGLGGLVRALLEELTRRR